MMCTPREADMCRVELWQQPQTQKALSILQSRIIMTLPIQGLLQQLTPEAHTTRTITIIPTECADPALVETTVITVRITTHLPVTAAVDTDTIPMETGTITGATIAGGTILTDITIGDTTTTITGDTALMATTVGVMATRTTLMDMATILMDTVITLTDMDITPMDIAHMGTAMEAGEVQRWAPIIIMDTEMESEQALLLPDLIPQDHVLVRE